MTLPEPGSARPDLLYALSYGFPARMLLHSGLSEEIQAQGLTLAVAAPNSHEAEFQALCGAKGVAVHPLPRPNPRWATRYQKWRRYLFEDFRGNPALWSKHLQELDNPKTRWFDRLAARMLLFVNTLAMRIPLLPALGVVLDKWTTSSRGARALLAAVRPRVLVATYPVDFAEAMLLREARRLGIPTVVQLLSWDNILCKGRFAATADAYISWGPIMTSELMDVYRVPRERIQECGVAHFDAHAEPDADGRVPAVLASLGLDPGKPYLLFAMSAPYFCPREIDVVEWLAHRVREDAFGSGMQLVVRPHPQNVTGSMADSSWIERLRALAGDRVGLDIPKMKASAMQWALDEEDLGRLVALLRGCTVSLNSCSTMTIDAILHDKPVVLPAFDADDRTLPWHRSVSRMTEYPHLRKLFALECARLAPSWAAVEDEVRKYAAEPRRDAAGRADARREECGPCDGAARTRIAFALRAWVDEARRKEAA